MNEIQYNYFVFYFGFILLFARVTILLSALFKFRELSQNNSFKFLFTFALLSVSIAVFEQTFIYIANNYTKAIMPYLIKFEIDDTFFISPFYFLNEIIFLSTALLLANRNAVYNKLKYIILIFAFFEILNTLFVEGYKDSQTIGSFLTSLLLIILSLIYVTNFSKNSKSIALKDGFFIISLSTLFTSLTSILIYFFTKNLFETNTKLYYQISIFRMAVEVICFFFISYGILILNTSKKPKI